MPRTAGFRRLRIAAQFRPAEALAEYDRSLGRDPNRYRSLFGAARAAAAAGKRDDARAYYARLWLLADKDAGSRLEPAEARAFLARQ